MRVGSTAQLRRNSPPDHGPGAGKVRLPEGLATLAVFLDLIYFTQKEEGREKERERNKDVYEKHQSFASYAPPTGDLACNPGMWPGGELNRRPFGSQAGTQPTEPHQRGLCVCVCVCV